MSIDRERERALEALGKLNDGAKTTNDIRDRLSNAGVDFNMRAIQRSECCPVAQYMELKTGRKWKVGGTFATNADVGVIRMPTLVCEFVSANPNFVVC